MLQKLVVNFVYLFCCSSKNRFLNFAQFVELQKYHIYHNCFFTLFLQLVVHNLGGVVTIVMAARMVVPHSPSNIKPIVYEDVRIVILVFGHGVAALRLVPIKLDHHHRRPPKIIIHTWTMHTVQLMRHCTLNWTANRYVRQIRHIKIRPTVSVVR